jgi:hypothetical protein
MTPDMAGTALGLVATYFFWRWLCARSWSSACAAGVTLGLTELARTTWIVLFALWPVLWVLCRWPDRREVRLRGWLREATMLFGIIVLSVYVINLGYCFEGSFQKLGQYHFETRTLTGTESAASVAHRGGNRFTRTWLGMLPVPLPMNYVQGIDAQKRDFERKMPSYLRGEWCVGGWWYYYLYALAIKVPLGTWLIVFLALPVSLFRPRHSASWRDELVLLAPVAVVLTLVSSQTGINQHMRYVLPGFPFVFVWASKVARGMDSNAWKATSIAAVALLWAATSSLWIYPHSLSYFNELVGGPTRGHAHLHDSNIDWGQDLLYLKRWLDEHPEARPLHLCYFLPHVDPRIAGIESTLPPPGPRTAPISGFQTNEERLGPQPGWHALSINEIRGHTKKYSYFLRFKPVAMAGYSIYIYHITCDEANRVRRELGLPDFPGAKNPDARANDDQIR